MDNKDYERVTEKGIDITPAIAHHMDKDAESKIVQDLIARHRKHLSQFYIISFEMYKDFGNMYFENS